MTSLDRVRSAANALGRSPVVIRAVRHRVGAWSVALVVALVVLQVVTSAQDQSQQWGRTAVVAVSSSAIGAGEPVLPSVEMRRLPLGAIPDGALSEVSDHGRATRDIPAGAVLTPSDLAGAERGPVAARLRRGRAAVVVTATGPELGPGDRVDVVGPAVGYVGDSGQDLTVDDEAPDGGSETSEHPPGTVLASDAEVLEVDGERVTLSVLSKHAAATASASLSGPVALTVVS